MNGSFPVDIIIFAMVAAFLALRLRSVLGRRSGFEQPPRPMARPGLSPFQRSDRGAGGFDKPVDKGVVIEGKAEPVDATISRTVPPADSPLGQKLAAIRAADPGFDAERFMVNAERAFGTILLAYCNGNRDVLRPLLTTEAFDAFSAAIDAREQAGETVRCELRRVHDMTIADADLIENRTDKLASITLRIVSDQINVTNDKSGRPVTGVDAVVEILDRWTFERHLLEPSPVWRLAGAQIG